MVCAVCGVELGDVKGGRRYCSSRCRHRAAYLARQRVGLATGPEEGLACLRCLCWVVDDRSDSGGWCDVGRWRLCKPWLEGVRPWRPMSEG